MPISEFKPLVAKGVGNTLTTIFTATHDCYFIQLDIKGPTTTGVQVDIFKYDTGATLEVEWLEGVPVPVGATLQALEGTKLVLAAGDELRVRCATPGEVINVIGSYINDVNS